MGAGRLNCFDVLSGTVEHMMRRLRGEIPDRRSPICAQMKNGACKKLSLASNLSTEGGKKI